MFIKLSREQRKREIAAGFVTLHDSIEDAFRMLIATGNHKWFETEDLEAVAQWMYENNADAGQAVNWYPY